jgi:hypothetical protein
MEQECEGVLMELQALMDELDLLEQGHSRVYLRVHLDEYSHYLVLSLYCVQVCPRMG